MLTPGQLCQFCGQPARCSGITAGACKEIVDDLEFAEGRFVIRLEPGQVFRPGKGKWRGVVIRSGPDGTSVFIGRPTNARTDEYFHFGLDDATDGVRIVPEGLRIAPNIDEEE